MITKNELQDIARFSHLKPYQQEKHYIQTIALNSIYSTVGNELVFKGGTCLLFFHGLNRFSEDLDFTLVKEIDINIIIQNIQRDFENLRINHNISKIKEDEHSISFKIGAEGPLFIREIERCFVRLDISKREHVFSSNILELKTHYKEILGFDVRVMEQKEILAEKIRALMTRNQARDLYDIHFLLKNGVKVDLSLVNKKLEYYKMEFSMKEFKKALRNKKEIWKPELQSLIIGKMPTFQEASSFVLKQLH